jgi:hypothetical protein
LELKVNQPLLELKVNQPLLELKFNQPLLELSQPTAFGIKSQQKSSQNFI